MLISPPVMHTILTYFHLAEDMSDTQNRSRHSPNDSRSSDRGGERKRAWREDGDNEGGRGGRDDRGTKVRVGISILHYILNYILKIGTMIPLLNISIMNLVIENFIICFERRFFK